MMRRGVVSGLKRWRRDRSGAAAIEFAFVAPMVVAAIIITICLGLYFFNCHQIDRAAREAARSVMMLMEPKAATVNSVVDDAFANLTLKGLTHQVAIEDRADGGKSATIIVAYKEPFKIPFMNIEYFQHHVTLRAPLRD